MAEEIPGYREAIERERFLWARTFCGINESICGIEVLQFTPLHHVRLELGKSPFIVGGIPKPEDVAVFLWALHPRYHPKSRWLKFWFFRKIGRRVQRQFPAFCVGISDYLEEVFPHSRTSRSAAGGKVYYNFCTSIAHQLCPKYGDLETVLNLPYAQIFQLLKPIHREAGTPPGCPSDSVRAAWRAKKNEELLKSRVN